MSEYDPYLAISLFVPRKSQKCVSSAYDIQTFLVLVSRSLCLIAMNMHYTKFTLWTPKSQILAKTLAGGKSFVFVPSNFPAREKPLVTSQWSNHILHA